MGSVLKRAELKFDAAFLASGGKYKNFADFKLAKDGTLFVLKTQSSDGARLLFKRNAEDKEWAQIETNGSVKNSVNEYGGSALHAHSKSNFAYTLGQSIFWNGTEFSHPNLHFADLNFVDNKFLYCVVEDHNGVESKQQIGQFNSEKDFKVIAKGSDFYGTPRLSPNAKNLLYISWNDPNMPWDATHVHLVSLKENGEVEEDVRLLPKSENALTNYQALQWNANNESFYYVSDESNYWSIYEYVLKSEESKLIASVEGKDLANAMWNVGDDRFYAINSKVVVYTDGSILYAKWLKNSHFYSIGSPNYTQYSRIFIDENNVVYCIASGPLEAETLLLIQIHENENHEIRVIEKILNTDEIKSAGIESPKSIIYNVLDDKGGKIPIEGFYYAPINKKVDGKPPLILLAHAGPTAQTSTTLDKKKLVYRGNGFALFDINYRGSTGYGRKFRDLLYNNWGEVDVIDVCEAAKHLIELDLVDKDKIFIVGSSASGYLVLRALYKEPKLFKAAVCSYGFSDLFALTAETHRFEKAYNDHLIAPQSEKHIWENRNMADKLDKIETPMLLFHGTEDKVVPYQQSEQIYKFLREKRIKSELQIFEGEGHGFRNSENIEKVLNGTLKFFYEAMGIDENPNPRI